MKRLAAITSFMAGAAALLAAGAPGIRPRANAGDYPAHESIGVATVGAAVIPSGEAKKIFGVDLDKAGYIVIEVGVFPAAGRELDLSPLDFTLRTDPNAVSERAADTSVIAAAAARPVRGATAESPAEEVSVTSGASVQHVSYPDPVTGKKTGATIAGVDSGVGVNRPSGPQPSATSSDPDRLEQQLWEKSLPDGKTAAAAAGYLYFPKPAKKAKNEPLVLLWENTALRVNISLPHSAK
jgi:hypothetical protein